MISDNASSPESGDDRIPGSSRRGRRVKKRKTIRDIADHAFDRGSVREEGAESKHGPEKERASGAPREISRLSSLPRRRHSQSPNKAPEPTPSAVTPRAIVGVIELKQWSPICDAARGAPAAVVAHL